MAFSTLKTKMGEYLDLTATTATNELIDMNEPLVLGLRMPSNYNVSTVDTLAAAAHQYVVSIAVGDWFTITNKSDAKEYSALADVSLQIIAEAVNKRSRPVREQKPADKTQS